MRLPGAVRLTCRDQKEPEAGCAITGPRLHSAIRSPPRLGRSAALIAGNLKDMYLRLAAADDLEFKSGTDSPTLRVDGMTVAGA